MSKLQIPVSWGELFDKITILDIKAKNFNSEIALGNIKKELKQLSSIYLQNKPKNIDTIKLENQLKQVNQNLWDIEDKIRDKEKHKSFDAEFIQIARSVYINNDERARIKKKLNNLLGSEIVEEKSYYEY